MSDYCEHCGMIFYNCLCSHDDDNDCIICGVCGRLRYTDCICPADDDEIVDDLRPY